MNTTTLVEPENTIPIADHPAFVFGAYIAAFAPLAIIYALDLISEKWKTIKETRRAGYLILLFSVPSLLFLFVYIHMQKLAGDYKEMAAATSAAIYSVLHVLRTIWGLLQLRVFQKWNENALIRLKWLGYDVLGPDESGQFRNEKCRPDCKNLEEHSKVLEFDTSDDESVKSSSHHSSSSNETLEKGLNDGNSLQKLKRLTKMKFTRETLSLKKYATNARKKINRIIYPTVSPQNICRSCKTLTRVEKTVNREMVVNSSLIDNEFAHAELPCQLDMKGIFKKLWLSRGKFWDISLLDYMRCKLPEECSVQWIVAFLSRFGSNWLLHSKNAHQVNDLAVLAALHVTHQVKVGESTDQFSLEHESVLPPGHSFAVDRREIQSSTLYMTPEVQDALPYKMRSERDVNRLDFAAYESNIRDAISSWHTVAVNKLEKMEREAVTKIEPYQVAMFAKLIGGDGENKISIESIDNDAVPPIAFRTFHEQIGNRDENNVFDSLPFRREFSSVLLWKGRFRNRFVLQASAHVDNWMSLECGQRQKGALLSASEAFKTRLPTTDIVTFQKELEESRLRNDLATASDLSNVLPIHKTQFLGCVVESVRSFLGKWVHHNSRSASDESIWNPVISGEKIKFRASRQLTEELIKLRKMEKSAKNLSSNESRNVNMRILWEVQSFLHESISEMMEEGYKSIFLPRSLNLIMLFLLGFPSITIRKFRQDLHASNDNRQTEINFDELIYEIIPAYGPQNVSIIFKHCSDSEETNKCIIELFTANEDDQPFRFDWQAWKDSVMGRLEAQTEWRERRMSSKTEKLRREILDAKIQNGLKSVNRETIETEYGLSYWSGWPPHLCQIALFEILESEELRKFESYYKLCDNSEKVVMRLERAMDALRYDSRSPETGKTLYTSAKLLLQRGQKVQWQSLVLRCIADYGYADALDAAVSHIFSGGSMDQEKLLSAIHKGIAVSWRLSKTDNFNTYPVLDLYKVAGYCDQLSILISDSAQHSVYYLKGIALFYAKEFEKGIDEGCLDAFESGIFYNSDCAFYLALCYYRKFHRNGHLEDKHTAAKFIRSYKSNGVLKTSFGYLLEKGSFPNANCKRLRALNKYVKNWVDSEALCELFCFLFLPTKESGIIMVHSDENISKYVGSDSEEIELGDGMFKDFGRATKLYKTAIKMHKVAALGGYSEDRSERNAGGDASNRLGMMYFRGPDISTTIYNQNKMLDSEKERSKKVEKLYLEAIEMSNINALCNIGIYHAERLDGARNGIRAFENMERAVFAGHSTAMSNLAVMIEKEIGCTKDLAQVKELYEKAIRKERNPIAAYNFAILLKFGDHEYRNERRANKILQGILKRSDLSSEKLLVTQAKNALKADPNISFEVLETSVEEYEDCFAYIKLLDSYVKFGSGREEVS